MGNRSSSPPAAGSSSARAHMGNRSSSPPAAAAGGGSTSSTIAPETVTGWHVLNVQGYSQIKGSLGIGKRIRSGAFSVGGHSWRITIFPDGYDEMNADWICVDLLLDRPAAAAGDDVVKARSTFSLLDQAGEPVSTTTSGGSDVWITFSSKAASWGFCNFIKRKDLESFYLIHDSFQIRCDVTVIKEIRIATTAVESLAVPPPPPLDLHRHLGDLLASQVGGDITFEVGGQLFTAHRCVLAARSSVFMAELLGPMKEKTTSRVQIRDMEARVFKAMLRFIYTDLPPEMEEEDKIVMAQHLLVAADRYNMERLRLICEDILRKCISTDMAATTLALAEQHGCHGLKEACFKFLKSPGNLKAVMASDDFEHLKRSCPSLLEELLAKVAP